MSLFQRNMVSAIAVSTLLAFTPICSAQAQEELIVQDPSAQTTANNTVSAIEEASTGEIEKSSSDGNPYVRQIEQLVKELAVKLSNEQSADLEKIRTAFGMIESVDMVRNNVSNAVENCNEQYPDLKDTVQGQFDAWQLRVLPVAEHYKGALDSAIDDGRFDDPALIRKYLNTIDKAAEFTDARLVRNPVISEQTCQGLAASMNNTKEELVSLMNDIEWPVGVDVKPLPDPAELVSHEQVESQSEETPQEITKGAVAEQVPVDVSPAPSVMEEVQTDTAEENEAVVEDVTDQIDEAATPSLEDLTKEAEALTQDAQEFSDSADEMLDKIEGTAQPNEEGEMDLEIDPVEVEDLNGEQGLMQNSLEEMEAQNRQNSMKSENEMIEMEIKQQLDSTMEDISIEVDGE